MIRTFRLVVWTANLGRGVDPKTFSRLLDRLMQAVHGWSQDLTVALLLQEVDEADQPNEHAEVRRRTRWWIAAGWATKVPILVWPHTATVTERLARFASAGLAGVSPTRVITRAVLTEPGCPVPVTLLNLHQARDVPAAATRRAMAWTTLMTMVAWERARGRAVIVAGDFNSHGDLPSMPAWLGLKVLHRRTLDVIMATAPRGWEWAVHRRTTVPIGIDTHRALAIDAELRPKAVS